MADKRMRTQRHSEADEMSYYQRDLSQKIDMGSFCIRELPEGVLFFLPDGRKQMPGVRGQCFGFPADPTSLQNS